MPELTVETFLNIAAKTIIGSKNIMFTPDKEKLKHLVGYLNTKNVFSAARVSSVLSMADFISLENFNRTLYGETYVASQTEVPGVICIQGITFVTMYMIDERGNLKDNLDLHEDCDLDFISGSDIAAIDEALKLFPNWSAADYKKAIDENKCTRNIQEELGDKHVMFVKWETVIKDFPEEKQRWLKEFDKAIVY